MHVSLTDSDQQHSYKWQEGDVERAAQGHAGDDEGDDEDDEANDHQGSDRLGPSWSCNTQMHKSVTSYEKTNTLTILETSSYNNFGASVTFQNPTGLRICNTEMMVT